MSSAPTTPAATAPATASAKDTKVPDVVVPTPDNLPPFDHREHPRLTLLKNAQVSGLHAIIRDCRTPRADFIFYANRIIRLVIEEGLNHLPFVEKTVTTPTGAQFVGIEFSSRICGVSVVRAGESMETGLRAVCKSARIGKILIQRDDNLQPHLYYVKLPNDIAERQVLLMEPMLATGHTIRVAVETLKKHGVDERNIILLNIVASEQGLAATLAQFPEMKIVTSGIDPKLNAKGYIMPGLGDFGDRYYGTEH